MECQSILIVEDEADIRETLKELLVLEGYQVFTASNGQEGLALLRSIPRPCVILLDVLMPVMDGNEFLAAKKDEDLIATIPVAIVTGIAEKPPLVGGAVACIKKPIEFEYLLKFIRKYCKAPNEQDPGKEQKASYG